MIFLSICKNLTQIESLLFIIDYYFLLCYNTGTVLVNNSSLMIRIIATVAGMEYLPCKWKVQGSVYPQDRGISLFPRQKQLLSVPMVYLSIECGNSLDKCPELDMTDMGLFDITLKMNVILDIGNQYKRYKIVNNNIQCFLPI